GQQKKLFTHHMKKYLLSSLFVMISVFTFAQFNNSSLNQVSSSAAIKPKASFGVRAGLSSASMRGDAVNNLNDLIDYANGMVTTNSRTGFFAGGFATIPIGGGISIEPGVYYTQKGYELKGSLNLKGVEFLNANATAKLQTNYIDIPLLLKVDLGGFQLFAGPQVSYLSNADLVMKAGVLGFNLLNKTMDVTEKFNRWDAAVTGGIGYKFSNGMSITASYDHGLSKVDANSNVNSYNKSFKVGLGISF
ncbi:MAG TPA: porin family protein, partial [Ferruginibacter sp.]|nr:porin family protein [Ferruginibacter sp.]